MNVWKAVKLFIALNRVHLSFIYIASYILHAKAIHNINAYIESSMTLKKSYLKPPNPPFTGA